MDVLPTPGGPTRQIICPLAPGFIANTTSTIPRPLLDRMEIIELTSYTDEEKLEIARRYLLPKQMKVLLTVQLLQQRRRGVSPVIAAHLVDLVQ